MRGYLTSGRATADHYFDIAMGWRRLARMCFRDGAIREGKNYMHEALSSYRHFRYFKARIVL